MLYPDISHWIPVRNWAEVKKNCGFIISKATQGTGYIDPTLDSFIKGCEANHIPYWLYTFLNRGNERAQAEFMVRVCKPKVGKYFRGYILDIEQNNSAAGVKQAMDYLQSLGGKYMIYTMWAQYSIYKGIIETRGSKCAWWEARYGSNTGKYNSAYPCHAGVDLHQYTSKGSCEGIGLFRVDLNRVCGSKKVQWFTGETKEEPVKPKKKTTLDLVYETMRGEYGKGDTRKRKLGDRYAEVQKMINHISRASAQTLAKETQKGMYGTGKVRQVVLGKRYAEVQNLINKKK